MVGAVKNCLAILIRSFRSRTELEAEILVLRHQLNVLRRKLKGRPPLTIWDRLLLVGLYRLFPSVLGAVAMIRPDTLIRWRRKGFRAHWRWRQRSKGGRPKVSVQDQPIIIATFCTHVRWGYPMDVSCHVCGRSATIDAAAFPPGLSYIGRRFRCSCGGRCRPSISKPQ